jgi:hypothetical protein
VNDMLEPNLSFIISVMDGKQSGSRFSSCLILQALPKSEGPCGYDSLVCSLGYLGFVL